MNEYVEHSIPCIAIMVATSIIYFATGKSLALPQRLLSSAHGLLGAILICIALIIGCFGHPSHSYIVPYTWLFVLPLASMVLAVGFKIDRIVHLLLLLNLPVLGWAWFVSALAIGGEWI